MFSVYKKIRSRLSYDYKIKLYIKQGLKIGENVKLYNVNIDHSHPYLISIGNNVTITNSDILAHDASTKMVIGKSKVGHVKIGNNVFIGYRCVLLPNITIGDNVIIGAGSVVNHDIPSNSVAVGNPCKIISNYDDFVNKHNEYYKKLPKFDSFAKPNKGMKYKNNMLKELANTFGYDE